MLLQIKPLQNGWLKYTYLARIKDREKRKAHRAENRKLFKVIDLSLKVIKTLPRTNRIKEKPSLTDRISLPKEKR